MELRGLWLWFEACKPYLFLTLNELCLAVFMILIESILSKGVSALAIVVYEHVVATVVISVLAFFLERQKRPPLSFKILCYAFLLGLLQITLCQLLLTMALEFIGSSYESIGLNLQTALIFVLAVVFGQEKFRFWSRNGQAKIWGVTISAAGVLSTVLWTGPTVLKSTNLATSEATFGVIMIIVGVLATCFWNIFVGHVTRMYPAELSLTAMMSFFGTIQTAIVTAIVIPSSSWKLQWDGGLVLVAILFGGIVITGLSYYVMTWSIHKRGPVFTSAFTPLLIVFSFLLDTFVLGDTAHLGSIVGAFLVIVGLYLILWAKADDMKQYEINDDISINSPLIQP
ncbi:WAT1-related protein At5g64700-like isoform X1 [Telopea speciosissima]|uniref:WAT1-related protein At5g64700-like isoform X1 n=1 Tax=Telopea speciosissima TaxID=54955 RepID=UPI001CC49A96|nr:WAT1-related protein At5g64700-like isoform X1 [Telopea speciosissima]